MSAVFKFTIANNSNFTLKWNVRSDWNCLDTESIQPPGFENGTVREILPGHTNTFSLCRRDGHGCNGKQGTFTIECQWNVNSNNPYNRMKSQSFDFDADGKINLTGGISGADSDIDYVSSLYSDTPGTYVWWLRPYTAPTEQQKIDTIRKYAPIIYLAEGEEFLPCSVDWAFPQMERVVRDGEFWLYAKQELSNPEDDSLALFKGQPVGSAKVYAFWVQKAALKFDIVYFVYYGYNRGKNVLGTVYGNHVSDWEHLTIRVNGALEAEDVYLSAHDGGDTRRWGTVERSNNGNGSQIIVYAAKGSHGMYAFPGDHQYKEIYVAQLVDECSKGTMWNTAASVVAYDWNLQRELGGTYWPNWMLRPNGLNPVRVAAVAELAALDPSDPNAGPIYRWGNGENGTWMFDQYPLEDGPTGPVLKDDCWDFGRDMSAR